MASQQQQTFYRKLICVYESCDITANGDENDSMKDFIKCVYCKNTYHEDCAKSAQCLITMNGHKAQSLVCPSCKVSMMETNDDLLNSTIVENNNLDLTSLEARNSSISLSNVLSSPDFINSLGSMITNSVNKAIEKAMSDSFDERLKVFTDKISRNDENMESLKKSVSELNEKVSQLGDVTDLASECTDRLYRANNILLFNLEENFDLNLNLNNDAADKTSAVSILQPLHSVNWNNTIMKRIGKYSQDKNRPILITLPSQFDVISLLKKKFEIPEPYYIRADLTETQRKEIGVLRSKIDNYKKDGIHKTLIYRNRRPVLVDEAISDKEIPDNPSVLLTSEDVSVSHNNKSANNRILSAFKQVPFVNHNKKRKVDSTGPTGANIIKKHHATAASSKN